MWSHNPRVAYSEVDKTWVMFHIGAGSNDTSGVKKCGKPQYPPGARSTTSTRTSTRAKLADHNKDKGSGLSRGRRSSEARSTFPFEIHHAADLDGTWESLSGSSDHDSAALFTLYPGVDNVGSGVQLGGIVLKEDPKYGNGTK